IRNNSKRGTRKRDGRLRLPPTKGLRDWRHQMPSVDVAAFEIVVGDLLQELGYQRGIDHLPASARLRARLRVLRHKSQFAVRRFFRRARFKTGFRLKATE